MHQIKRYTRQLKRQEMGKRRSAARALILIPDDGARQGRTRLQIISPRRITGYP